MIPVRLAAAGADITGKRAANSCRAAIDAPGLRAGHGREPAAHFLGYPLTELEDLADDIVYSFDRKTSAEAV